MVEDDKRDSSAEDGIKVLIGGYSAHDVVKMGDSVRIDPFNDGWNDFGFQSMADLNVRMKRGVSFRIRAYSGFISLESASTGSGNEWIAAELKRIGKSKAQLDDSAPFFSLLPDMESYRRIVSELGLEDAMRVLLAVHDLVALGEQDSRIDLTERARGTEVFARSFMRNSSAYFAFKNAASIIRGLELEQSGVLSKSLSIRFRLAACANDHDLSFSFDHEAHLPKRMSVVIGKNGVGKSQTLGRIAEAAIGGSDALSDGTKSGRPIINRLLAFAPTSETSSVFPPEQVERPRIWYKKYSISRSRAAGAGQWVSDLILQLARSGQSIGKRTRWEIFIGSLQAIGGHKNLCLTSFVDGNEVYVPFSRLDSGPEQQRLDRFSTIDSRLAPVRVVEGEAFDLSSGELSFLTFSAQVSAEIENGTLLLLDEPETHLHPNFVSRFVSLLDSLLEQTDSSAIIATHSAFFVREVFREQVTVLSVDEEGVVSATRPALRTFGADVGAISYFVFGEDEPSRLVRQVTRKLVKSGKTWDEIYSEYRDELSLEMLSDIRASLEGEVGV